MPGDHQPASVATQLVPRHRGIRRQIAWELPEPGPGTTRGGVLKGACPTAGELRAEPYSADYVFLR